MQRAIARLALLAALLLVIAKVGAVLLDSSSLSPRISPYVWQGGLLLILAWIHRSLSGETKAGGLRLFGSLLVVGLGGSTAAFVAMIAVVDRGLAERTYADVIDHPQKVWSTRGLVSGGAHIDGTSNQNTVESVSLAFDRGAQGVEVDVFWDQELNRFAVSHDRPYKTVNGKMLPLGEMLESVKQPRAWWLDWKKVRHLDAEQLESALARLTEITAASDLRTRFYVEAEDPINLRGIKRAGFKTILDTHPLPESSPFAPVLIDAYKALYYFTGHTVMSMESGAAEELVLGSDATRLLRHVPLFVYHVPNENQLFEELVGLSDVRVVLPRDHTLDRFGLTN